MVLNSALTSPQRHTARSESHAFVTMVHRGGGRGDDGGGNVVAQGGGGRRDKRGGSRRRYGTEDDDDARWRGINNTVVFILFT